MDYSTATEIAFLAEDATFDGFIHNYALYGKFIIPVLTPMMDMDHAIEEVRVPATVKIQNNAVNTTRMTKTNYVELPIPFYLLNEFIFHSSIRRFGPNYEDTNLFYRLRVPKDTEFLVTFVGKDPNKIRVTGLNKRY